MTITAKELIIAPLALADLQGIRRYIAESIPHYAREVLADLTMRISCIAEVDFTDSQRDHISEGLRAYPYRQRCIYYRSYPDRVVVLRAMHGARDIKPHDSSFSSRVSEEHNFLCLWDRIEPISLASSGNKFRLSVSNLACLIGIGPAASIWTRKLFPDIAAQHMIALMECEPATHWASFFQRTDYVRLSSLE